MELLDKFNFRRNKPNITSNDEQLENGGNQQVSFSASTAEYDGHATARATWQTTSSGRGGTRLEQNWPHELARYNQGLAEVRCSRRCGTSTTSPVVTST